MLFYLYKYVLYLKTFTKSVFNIISSYKSNINTKMTSSIHTRSQDKHFKEMVNYLFSPLSFNYDELYNIPYMIDFIKYFYEKESDYINGSPYLKIPFLQKMNRKRIIDIPKEVFFKQINIIFRMCENTKNYNLKTCLFLLLTNFVLFYLNNSHLDQTEKIKISNAFLDKLIYLRKKDKWFLEYSFNKLSVLNVKDIHCPYLHNNLYPNTEYWFYMWENSFSKE